MFYIHQARCISPQRTFPEIEIDELVESLANKLLVSELRYQGVSPTALRRMGKSVRVGTAAALSVIEQIAAFAGIIIGTGNGGMEESVKFLKQIIEYDEDLLAPGTFVQSTSNALASQIALVTDNMGYNITHVHRGLAFENALIDAAMKIRENESNTYLLGGVDEISGYNNNLDRLEGWFKKEEISNKNLYDSNSAGSIAGEGAAVFAVNNDSTKALAAVLAVRTLHSEDEKEVEQVIRSFLKEHLPEGKEIDLLVSGENGDNRFLHFYFCCEKLIDDDATVIRFKHMTGEYPTASAFALWIVCQLPYLHTFPGHMIKRMSSKKEYNLVLIYNHFKGKQHSLMLVSVP